MACPAADLLVLDTLGQLCRALRGCLRRSSASPFWHLAPKKTTGESIGLHRSFLDRVDHGNLR